MRLVKKFGELIRVALLFSAFGAMCMPAEGSTTLVVNNYGVLMGAKNIPVEGGMYDVRFVEGTYQPIFEYAGPQKVSFSDSLARAASQALLDFVFVDGAQGHFDSSPGMTSGCWNNYILCLVYTPLLPGVVESISPSGLPRMTVWTAMNYEPALGSDVTLRVDVDRVQRDGVFVLDNTNPTIATWALWSPSAAVPEPNSWSFFLIGFLVVGLAVRSSRAP